jgi:uncharacterized protein YjbJ (UPF0337 family)
MNKQQIKGMANEATGEVKEQVGKMTGDKELELKGHAREMAGKAQKKMGDAKEAIKDAVQDEQARRAEEESLKRRP